MKELLFLIAYFIILYFSGRFVVGKMQFKINNLFALFSIGFIFQLAIIQLFGWWMVAFHKPMSWFFILVCIVSVGRVILGIKEVKTKKVFRFQSLKNNILKKETIVLGILMLLVCFALLFLYRSDADDSFYVSNVLLFSKSDILNQYDSSFGNETFGTVPMYDFQIWESYLAVLCKIFSIKASVMCHYVMVFALLFIAISAQMLLAQVLFKSKKKSCVFVWYLMLFYCMGGYAVYSKGSFLLSRIWQGKAVYLHIVLPVVIGIILFYTENKDMDRRLSLYLLMTMLAGLALNPTSMYVVGFEIIFMIIAVAINYRDWRIMLQAIPSVVVIAFFAICILLRTNQFDGQIEAASTTQENFAIQVFKNFMGTGKLYFAVYIMCCFIIWFKGERKGRILCVITPILLFLGIWNPIMAPIVAQNLTMVPSYWRVFWLLPIDFAIAYCGVLFYKKKKMEIMGSVFLVFMIIVPGTYMFTESNYFINAENKERIPQEVLEFGEIIAQNESKQIVLANDKAATTLRQEFNEIELIFSRYQYILDLVMYRGEQEEANERISMMEFVNGSGEVPSDYSYIKQLLNKYEVEWIIIDKSQQDSINFLQTSGYQVQLEMNETILLRKQGNVMSEAFPCF